MATVIMSYSHGESKRLRASLMAASRSGTEDPGGAARAVSKARDARSVAAFHGYSISRCFIA